MSTPEKTRKVGGLDPGSMLSEEFNRSGKVLGLVGLGLILYLLASGKWKR